MKERHPFALTFAIGPRTRTSVLIEQELGNESKVNFARPRLSPILTSKFRLSFLRRSHRPQVGPTGTTDTPDPPLQLPELPFHRNETRIHHQYDSFPRSHQNRRSTTSSPRVYLHTPQRELDGQTSPPPPSRRHYGRRLSLPTTPHPAVNSNLHMPASVESYSPPSTRASLKSIATNSLALGSVLERAQGEMKGMREYMGI